MVFYVCLTFLLCSIFADEIDNAPRCVTAAGKNNKQ